jgi:glycosyltransferase involved in cell wall biosynthesis
MKIIQITPGTGNFICGNCVRENALAHALRRLGHDVLMVPLYLPMVTDEPNASEGTPLFLGGINVFLQQKSPIFRHTPRWLDSIMDHPGLLRWSADHAHMTRAHDLGELTVATLEGGDGALRKEIDRCINWIAESFQPDIVCLANALLIGMAGPLKKKLRVPVVVSLQGEDSYLNSLPSPWKEQAWEITANCVEHVDAMIAVSRTHAEKMQARLSAEPEKINVIYNGINLEGYTPQEQSPDPPVLGFLARMCPGKGLSTLVESFIMLHERESCKNLKLRIAGAKTPGDDPYVNILEKRLVEAGMLEHVSFHPNLTRGQKQEFYRGLSVFSVPATYGESFGLYLLEALASGIPVVQPRHGAFPEILGMLQGGLLCEPDDPESLADGIESLVTDRERAHRLGRAGRDNVAANFSIERAATELSDLLINLVRQPSQSLKGNESHAQ